MKKLIFLLAMLLVACEARKPKSPTPSPTDTIVLVTPTSTSAPSSLAFPYQVTLKGLDGSAVPYARVAVQTWEGGVPVSGILVAINICSASGNAPCPGFVNIATVQTTTSPLGDEGVASLLITNLGYIYQFDAGGAQQSVYIGSSNFYPVKINDP